MHELHLIKNTHYFNKLKDLVMEQKKSRLAFANFFESRGYLKEARSLIIQSIKEQGSCSKREAELLLKTFE